MAKHKKMHTTRPRRTSEDNREERLALMLARTEEQGPAEPGARRRRKAIPVKPASEDLTQTVIIDPVLRPAPTFTASAKPPAGLRGIFGRKDRRIVAGATAFLGCAMALTGAVLHGAPAAEANAPIVASVFDGLENDDADATPESLKKVNGAADVARFNATRTAVEGTTLSQCELKEGANSLASAFVTPEEVVVNPVAEGTYRNTSQYGARRDPFTGLGSFHEGHDFAANAGTPIYSVADGKVVYVGAGINGRSSNLVIIEHNVGGKVFTTWYVHMYSTGIHVKVGDKVEAGQHIADIGSAGRSTGPHLHFEVHEGANYEESEAVAPLPFLKELGAIDVSEVC